MLTLVGRLCPFSAVDVEMGAQLRMAMVWSQYALAGGTIPCHIISRPHRRPRSSPRRSPMVTMELVVAAPRGPMGALEAESAMMVGGRGMGFGSTLGSDVLLMLTTGVMKPGKVVVFPLGPATRRHTTLAERRNLALLRARRRQWTSRARTAAAEGELRSRCSASARRRIQGRS